MTASEFLYRDVSNQPGMEARADHGPELRQALIDLGFGSVGYVEKRRTRVFTKREAKLAKRVWDPSDLATIRDRAEHGAVIEVLASPDGRALAAVDRHIDDPVIVLRTVSEGGWVVDTSLEFPRGPRYRKNPLALLTKVFGRGPSTLGTRPRAGYFEAFASVSAAELWELHQERVHAILERGGQALRPHDSVAIYIAGSYHVHRVLTSVLEPSRRFTRWLTVISRVLLILLGLGSCLICLGLAMYDKDTSPAFAFAMAGMLGILGVMVLASWVFHRRIQPGLTGPGPMALDRLLEEIERLGCVSGGGQ